MTKHIRFKTNVTMTTILGLFKHNILETKAMSIKKCYCLTSTGPLT